MKKIRINELARELEVKAHEILERLPELGVQEKKTHSSSIDEDVAIKLRRLYGFDVPDLEPSEAEEPVAQVEAGPAGAAEPFPAPIAEARPVPAEGEAAPAAEKPPVERPAAPAAPIRPPLAGGRPIHPPAGGAPRPSAPAPPPPPQPAPAA